MQGLACSAPSVLCEILDRCPDIRSLFFFEPPTVPPLQDRLGMASQEALGILESALRMRAATAAAFWDATLLSAFGAGPPAVAILEQVLLHNGTGGQLIRVEAGDCDEDRIANMSADAAKRGRSLAVSSRVYRTDGQLAHIPMLDFHCPKSETNSYLARVICRLIGDHDGYLLQSEKSYHYYGSRLLEEETLPSFLGRALLFSPFVDRAWVAHQLIEGACGLRVSGKPGGGIPPVLDCRIGDAREHLD